MKKLSRQIASEDSSRVKWLRERRQQIRSKIRKRVRMLRRMIEWKR